MHITQITYNTPEYHTMLRLRDEVLRKPLGIYFDVSKLGNEETDFLIACYEEEKMIGCVILSPLNQTDLKLRQMAVDESYRDLGIGREMVAWAEAFALSEGYNHIEMNARSYAIPFYKKQGYTTYGDEFTEVGIPHVKMKKKL